MVMERAIQVKKEITESVQAAAVERDVSARLKLLQHSQEALLHADTGADTISACLDKYLNLQADSSTAIRRFAAFFIERLLLCKPGFALRCVSTVASLLRDTDGVVQELAVRAASVLHPRALYALSLEDEALQFQKYLEQLQQVQEAIREFLVSGCPQHPGLFALAARWAKVAILAQTPSPVLQKIRVPPEIRGVSCLQDFPERIVHHLDLNSCRQQSEDLFFSMCHLMEHPPQGRWQRSNMGALIKCCSSISRQRPMFLRGVLDIWRRLLKDTSAVLDGKAPSRALPVTLADTGYLRQRVWTEIQTMLASNILVEWRGELVEVLRGMGVSGSLEDLVTQAKCQQMCTVLKKRSSEVNSDARKKRLRAYEPARVWAEDATAADIVLAAGASAVAGVGLSAESTFDGDALLSGEVEHSCRSFEDYFGLPSQREPAGHVSGPALLASRLERSELARLAITSLNSLSEKRALLRDKAHERAITFGDIPQRGTGSKDSGRAGKGDADLSLFLTATPILPDDEAAGSDDEAVGRDPRAHALPNAREQPAADSAKNGGGGASTASVADNAGDQLLPMELTSVQLPSELSAKDGLELQLFQEVLEAQRRMSTSLLHSFSPGQLAAFEALSQQVALHLAAGTKIAVNPSLQRAMSKAFLVHAFDMLKLSLGAAAGAGKGLASGAGGAPGGAIGTPAVALEKLVELFYAKFSTDVARWQESQGHATKPAAQTVAQTPLREVLEGPPNGQNRRLNFTYAELFDVFMAEFEARDLPKRELRTFLNEIPYVPLSAFKILEKQCQQASSRKMALLTILSLMESKPACRWYGLHLLFKLAYGAGEDSSVRFDTIRLIINKIYSSGPKPPMRWQLPHLGDEEARSVIASDVEPEATIESEEYVAYPRLRGRCVEDVATLMLRSMAPDSAKFSFTVAGSPRAEQLYKELFRASVCVPKDRVWLYLALCIKRPVLLHELVETFTQCDLEMKEHLINSIEEAIKYIPASEQELLTLVQKATPKTERLVLKVLHILMQTSSQGKAEGLSKEYGEAVTRLYSITQNPRLLVPVFDLLDRKNLLDFLPAVVQLEEEQVRDAFQQLVRSKAPPLSTSELLTELHHLNKPNENIVPIKCSMQALNIMFNMREQYDAKVYGIVIQSLVEEQGTLPTLFMRTVIQVVKELPRLSDFIVAEILPRLVRQEVWGDENMWRGFMIVLQHTFVSQSGNAARVLAMLPMSQLEDVLVQHPDWKAQLREFVARQPVGALPPHVRQLLQ